MVLKVWVEKGTPSRKSRTGRRENFYADKLCLRVQTSFYLHWAAKWYDFMYYGCQCFLSPWKPIAIQQVDSLSSETPNITSLPCFYSRLKCLVNPSLSSTSPMAINPCPKWSILLSFITTRRWLLGCWRDLNPCFIPRLYSVDPKSLSNSIPGPSEVLKCYDGTTHPHWFIDDIFDQVRLHAEAFETSLQKHFSNLPEGYTVVTSGTARL